MNEGSKERKEKWKTKLAFYSELWLAGDGWRQRQMLSHDAPYPATWSFTG